MKKILLVTVVLALVSGCSLFRKKDSNSGSDSVRTETTANGSSESYDNSPVNLNATGSDSGSIAGLQTVFFDFDSSTLSASEKEKLVGNIEWMKKNSQYKMTIEGHTDARGSSEYNLALGERRANAVRQIMTENGLSSSRLTIVSFGKEKPLVNAETEEAMAKNRRANFVPVQ